MSNRIQEIISISILKSTVVFLILGFLIIESQPKTTVINSNQKEKENIEIVKTLIEDYSCWTSTEENDEFAIPGKVIYSSNDNNIPRIGNETIAGLALEQMFEGKDHQLKIYYFCP